MPPAVQLRAAEAVLDRTGLGGRTAIEIDTAPWRELVDAVIVDDGDAANARPDKAAQVLRDALAGGFVEIKP